MNGRALPIYMRTKEAQTSPSWADAKEFERYIKGLITRAGASPSDGFKRLYSYLVAAACVK